MFYDMFLTVWVKEGFQFILVIILNQQKPVASSATQNFVSCKLYLVTEKVATTPYSELVEYSSE